MTTEKKPQVGALVPPRAASSGKSPQEKAARAIAIRESTAKARKGRRLTFQMHRLHD